MTQKKTTKLGATGPEVFPLSLGCMGMSGAYGKTDDAESIATIQAASEMTPMLLDTGDFYGMGYNEMLIGRAMQGRQGKVLLSVKFGAQRGPDGSWLGFDGRPAAVKTWAAYSLQRLGVEVIDVYRPARLDPQVPIEDTVGAVADLIKAGYVRHIGLSEVGADTVRRAHKVHPIVDLQIEYSVASRGPESKIFPALTELGISATLYSVLGRGLLTGKKVGGPGDFRAHMPRFAKGAVERNEAVSQKLATMAKDKGMTVGQLLIGYVLAKEPKFLPVIGARTRAQWSDAVAALEKPLAAADVRAVEELVPPGAIEGGRYADAQMKHLDSEK